MPSNGNGNANLATQLAPLSVAVLLALGIVFVLPGLYNTLTKRDYFAEVRKRDPKIGTKIELPKMDFKSRPIPDGKKVLVVLGPCQSCSIRSFNPAKLTVPSQFRPIYLIQSKPEDISKDLRESIERTGGRTIADAKQTLRFALNAEWMPRMYLLDESNKISAIQDLPLNFPGGIKYDRSSK